jgi:Fur family peroxide stress response transcriptional regulator
VAGYRNHTVKKPTKAKLRDRLRSHCREHGLRVTPQREAIYSELCCDGTHPTAEQLNFRLRTRFPNLSLDTVNRTLLTFAEIGLIDIVEGHGSPRRYDPDTESHHHAYCIRCGAILDFQNASYDELKVPADVRRKFKITSKKVVLNGICSKCQRRAK